MLTFGSLFSGIGGFDEGFERAGMTPVWQVECDKQCQQVLAHHWPDLERHGNVSGWTPDAFPDLICGGFPCQDLSVAGRRAGLAGGRSGLWHDFHRILDETTSRWCVIENVPGLYSSHGGRDLLVILRGLVEIGYGVAWRCLDAQYFGLAQRRKRVFIVGCLGDARRAAEVLLEPESLPGNPAPSREAGQDVAGTLGRGSPHNGFGTGELDSHGAYIAFAQNQRDEIRDSKNLAGSCAAEPGMKQETFVTQPLYYSHDYNQDRVYGTNGVSEAATVARRPNYLTDCGVRRLMPIECCRLQGFPDDWLDLNPPLADGPKYRMLGNAVAVPVAEWIGRRILENR